MRTQILKAFPPALERKQWKEPFIASNKTRPRLTPKLFSINVSVRLKPLAAAIPFSEKKVTDESVT